jgi:catalase
MERIEGDVTRRKISLKNDFAQAGDRYRSLSTIDQDHLIDNIVDSLEKADKPMQERMVDHFIEADSELGARVAQGLHL